MLVAVIIGPSVRFLTKDVPLGEKGVGNPAKILEAA